jgi:Uncharacterized conserved protein
MDREEIVDELVKAIEKGGKLTANAKRLAKKHNITAARILSWYYQDRPAIQHHGNCSLTFEQEQQLLYSIIAMSNSNLDWTISQTQDFAKMIFDVQMTTSSAHRFLKRHADHLTFQKSLSLGTKRTEDGLYEAALFFAEKMEKFFGEKQFRPSQIVNYDECRICLNREGKCQMRRLVSKSKTKPQHLQKVKGKHVGTFLPFVSADGEVISTYMIFAAKFDETNEADVTIQLPKLLSKSRRSLQLSKIYWTDTGYINNEVFYEIIEDFTRKWQVLYPGTHCCLIGDNLGIHRNLQIIERALQQSIYMCYLVANTTHWSQPLDNLLFARLKQEVSYLTTNLSFQQVFTSDDLISMIDVVLRAAYSAFSKATIRKSFAVTGLCPFSPEKITKLAYTNHPPPSSTFTPTSEHEYFVQKTVEGVQSYLQTMKQSSEAQAAKIKTVRPRIQKNVGYDPESILAQARKEEITQERAQKEKEMLKAQRDEEKRQRKEQKEKEKQERERIRENRRVEKEQHEATKRKYQKAHTCRENCGAKCRTGPKWVGCDWCDEYWVCPACYAKPAVKGRLTKHERRCQKTEIEK